VTASLTAGRLRAGVIRDRSAEPIARLVGAGREGRRASPRVWCGDTLPVSRIHAGERLLGQPLEVADIGDVGRPRNVRSGASCELDCIHVRIDQLCEQLPQLDCRAHRRWELLGCVVHGKHPEATRPETIRAACEQTPGGTRKAAISDQRSGGASTCVRVEA
jgi:hypothetical protein